MSTLAVPYRVFELPWTPSAADERRYRRVLGAALGLFIGFGIVIPLLPDRVPTRALASAVPERIVEFILEQPKPKPVPKVEVVPPKPVVEQRVERPTLKPVPVVQAEPKPDPRKRAAAAGLLALSSQLAELRDLEPTRDTPAKALNTGAGEVTRVDRSLLTAKVGSGSGGIVVGEASRGFGGGSTGLKGVATATVTAPVAGGAGPKSEAQRSGQSAKAARTREEIELVFDKNKSAIYAIYSRALRDNPALQGKLVLEVTIAPTGEVTECRVISSELGDAELERKLAARIRMFRFEARDVAVMTTTKPIDFFPA